MRPFRRPSRVTDHVAPVPLSPVAMTGAPRLDAPGPPLADEPRFAAHLLRIASEAEGERTTIGALADAFGRRGHGALLILLGLPNLLPLPVPALSLLTGLPLLVLTGQIALGRPVPWFPVRLRERSLPTADLRRISGAVAVQIARLDRIVRPRWTVLTEGPARRVVGAFALVLAVALFLPLPFGNALPGLALALIGLALLERDGAALLAAVVVGLLGLAVTTVASAAILGGVFVFLRGVLPG